jgi:asparagine synthetase B (glutamine-hydrolysing)
MCGIFVSISKGSRILPTPYLKQFLGNRGPDHLGEITTKTGADTEAVRLFFTSTVLALRGGQVTAQPLSDPFTESVLCWNGEAWKVGQELVTGNDGQALLNLLVEGASTASEFDSIAHVLRVVRSISGPFAFVYFDKSHNLLYFGRDFLGRRSLLYNTEDVPDAVQFSSIADSPFGAWKEVEADGIYVLALTDSPGLATHVTSPADVCQMFSFLTYTFPYKAQGEPVSYPLILSINVKDSWYRVKRLTSDSPFLWVF